MEDKNVQVFYDDKGAPIAVQMNIADYEKLIGKVKESVRVKEALNKAIESLKAVL